MKYFEQLKEIIKLLEEISNINRNNSTILNSISRQVDIKYAVYDIQHKDIELAKDGSKYREIKKIIRS